MIHIQTMPFVQFLRANFFFCIKILNYGNFYLKCYKNSSLDGPNDLTTVPFDLACKLPLETTPHMTYNNNN